MLEDRAAESAALPAGFDSLRLQRVAFTILNLFLLLVLLALHVSFASFWGKTSGTLLAILGVCFAVRTLELLFLRRHILPPRASAVLTAGSIGFNLVLALVLASVIDREDSQYAALLVVPILESAFRFGLWPTMAVAITADGITFYWVWRYYALHPPLHIGEYFEAGTTSIIFLIVGLLVSAVAQRLRREHEQLTWHIAELDKTRERLLHEEKLAAIGRLSSAMAHEVRSPVAMISSSLATARRLTGNEREEMFEIAAKESERLVTLTTGLLAYGKPRRPAPAPGSLRDTALYVADACRAHAQEKGLVLRVDSPDEMAAEYDAGLVEQALMNLVLNAIQASPPAASVELEVRAAGDDEVRIDVTNQGGPIPASALNRLFEPFFTTKPAGTGLGLATAYSAMRAQGGDLVLTGNTASVSFSLRLPRRARQSTAAAGS